MEATMTIMTIQQITAQGGEEMTPRLIERGMELEFAARDLTRRLHWHATGLLTEKELIELVVQVLDRVRPD
jgi:hypothetical protein